MITLNVNIDHVATVRQSRGGIEPDPVTAALIAELAGASAIVCHLREDRRHIQDRDARLIRECIQTKMDLEMATSEEIIKIALELKPDLVTIVPEKRQELTTEGGLDLNANFDKNRNVCERMHERGIEVSFFIEPIYEQIDAAVLCGADMVELHTGTYANLTVLDEIQAELKKLQEAAIYAKQSDLKVAAGHGLNYQNIKPMCCFKEIDEFSIGHSIISRSIFSGLDKAVRDMIDLINTHK